jgi:hypothetical protein
MDTSIGYAEGRQGRRDAEADYAKGRKCPKSYSCGGYYGESYARAWDKLAANA